MELPLGATEDRICGTINIEKALQEGLKAYEPGLLVRTSVRPGKPPGSAMLPPCWQSPAHGHHRPLTGGATCDRSSVAWRA